MCILQDGTERRLSIGEEGRVEIGMHTGSREILTRNQCTQRHAGSDTDTEREMQNFVYITHQCSIPHATQVFVYTHASICVYISK